MRSIQLHLRRSGPRVWGMLVLVALLLAACSSQGESNIPQTGGEPLVAATVTQPPLEQPTNTMQPSSTPQAQVTPTEAQPAVTQVVEVQEATPICETAAATQPNMEGPYYTPNSPERSSLIEAGMEGTRLVLTGTVLTTDCQPIPGAWVDFWQADASGAYDNAGYRLRGHQFTGDDGSYRLETVLPANYGSRPRHIHVKVQAPGGPVLTTQIYFLNDPGNNRDGSFEEDLAVALSETPDGLQAQFNFILNE